MPGMIAKEREARAYDRAVPSALAQFHVAVARYIDASRTTVYVDMAE